MNTKEVLRKSIVKNEKKLKEIYVKQKLYYCGAASAAMALKLFGEKISQERIGKAGKTKTPGGIRAENLVKGINKVSKKCEARFLSFRTIGNLKTTVKKIIKAHAVPILWFYKAPVFPARAGGHYVLCIGIFGENLIIVDPNRIHGGLYLVETERMNDAIAKWSKYRGIVIVAKKNSKILKLKFPLKKERRHWLKHLEYRIEMVVTGELKKIFKNLKYRGHVYRLMKVGEIIESSNN